MSNNHGQQRQHGQQGYYGQQQQWPMMGSMPAPPQMPTTHYHPPANPSFQHPGGAVHQSVDMSPQATPITIERARRIARTIMKYSVFDGLDERQVEQELMLNLPSLPETRWSAYCQHIYSMDMSRRPTATPVSRSSETRSPAAAVVGDRKSSATRDGGHHQVQTASVTSGPKSSDPSLHPGLAAMRSSPNPRQAAQQSPHVQGSNVQQKSITRYLAGAKFTAVQGDPRNHHGTNVPAHSQGSSRSGGPPHGQSTGQHRVTTQTHHHHHHDAQTQLNQHGQSGVQQRHVDWARQQLAADDARRRQNVANLRRLTHQLTGFQNVQNNTLGGSRPFAPAGPSYVASGMVSHSQGPQAYRGSPSSTGRSTLPGAMPAQIAPRPFMAGTRFGAAAQQIVTKPTQVPHVSGAAKAAIKNGEKSCSVLAHAVLLAAGRLKGVSLNQHWSTHKTAQAFARDLKKIPFDDLDPPVPGSTPLTNPIVLNPYIVKVVQSYRGRLKVPKDGIPGTAAPTTTASDTVAQDTVPISRESINHQVNPPQQATAPTNPAASIPLEDSRLTIATPPDRSEVAATQGTLPKADRTSTPSTGHNAPNSIVADATNNQQFISLKSDQPRAAKGQQPFAIEITLRPTTRDASHNPNEVADVLALEAARSKELQRLDPVQKDPDEVESEYESQPESASDMGFPVFRCGFYECGAELHSYDNLVMHCDRVHCHRDISGSYLCRWGDCFTRGVGFAHADRWQAHMDEEHQQGIRYACCVKGCKKAFPYPEELALHCETAHPAPAAAAAALSTRKRKRGRPKKQETPRKRDEVSSNNRIRRASSTLAFPSDGPTVNPNVDGDDIDLFASEDTTTTLLQPTTNQVSVALDDSPMEPTQLPLPDSFKELNLDRYVGWHETWDIMANVTIGRRGLRDARKMVPVAVRGPERERERHEGREQEYRVVTPAPTQREPTTMTTARERYWIVID